MEYGNRKTLYLITLSVSFAFVATGIASAWPTTVLHKFTHNETNVEISEIEFSYVTTTIPIGFVGGSLASRYIADRFGRRTTILGSAVPIAIGSLIVVLTVTPLLLCFTTFAWSCGSGMVSCVIGCYLSEIADKDIRGTLSMITGVAFKVGTMFTMCIGPFISYSTINYTMLVLGLCYPVLCWWVPETPHFFLKSNNVDGARSSLSKLRGYKNAEMVENELLELRKDVKREMRHSSSFKELFTGAQYRKAIIIASGLKLTQILTGGIAIKQYLSLIVGQTKMGLDTKWVLVIYGVISFVVGFMTSILVDRIGRRPLLVFSYVGTGVALGVAGLYFFLQEVIHINSDALITFASIPFIGIIVAHVISTLGFNSLIHLIPSEIFPINVRAVALTSLNIFGAAIAALIPRTYEQIKTYVGYYAALWVFAVFGILGGVFSYFIVTETKGKDLREIQEELQGDCYHLDNDEKVEMVDCRNGKEGQITELQELKKGD